MRARRADRRRGQGTRPVPGRRGQHRGACPAGRDGHVQLRFNLVETSTDAQGDGGSIDAPLI